MGTRLAIICPGQGGQHPDMFALASAEPRLQRMLASWLPHAKLDAPLEDILHDPDQLFRNRNAQPLVLMASLLVWQGLRDMVPAPALVCGYSLGELSAYAVADSIACEHAIDLAAQRAALMDDCAHVSTPQEMWSVSGLDRSAVEELLPRQSLFIAIETGANSFIVGGHASVANEFACRVKESGGVAAKLPVAVASHTPLLNQAAESFSTLLHQSHFGDPRYPVLAGISALPVRDAVHAQTALCLQIAQKILWADCMDACAESGIGVVLEIGPGSAMSRMMQARYPHLECRSVADFRSLAGIAFWLRRTL